MSTMNFECRPLEPFGLEILCASPTGPDETSYRALADLFHKEGLLVFRGLQLSHEEQIQFCRHFGPVPDSPYENFLVSNVADNGHLGTRELLWHNDVAYLPLPYQAASLHALQVDKDAIGTRFANGYRACEWLPQEVKDRIVDLNALQVRERVFHRPNRLTDLQAGDICTVHPVVRTHPASGRPYLFVNEDMTACIIGMTESESDQLLQELFSYFYAEENVYEHEWSMGDLVLWDNMAMQHARGRAGKGVRTLQRVTIASLGYAQQYPTDTGIYESLHNQSLGEAVGD